ncbi:unnamed protein product [Cyprideis torosa]|uniref:Uncharacterized protein n=1 Tax=Cyprideis torosa TaxID=163714 RepID=A0A7R8ZVD0_9CRUS|nr:unnamed protein product [Cyprideis torosa]CAG0907376.1 unnamed protein product [Cyprideis torosa]
MNYLSALNLTKTYGIRTLFSEVSFHVNQGDQIALVAKNGSGKSTLLKILASKETPDSGEVQLQKDLQVVLFEQSDDFNPQLTAEDYIFNHSNALLELIRKYEKLIENDPTHPDIMPLMEQMDAQEAWKAEALISEIVSRLKIDFLPQKIEKLSGGQRKRIGLAKFLIDVSLESGHQLLILDEPTNHLDIEMVEWLEYFLNKENKTMIIVTHDRYFLDAVCGKIFEMEDQTLYVHSGSYATYVHNKALRIDNQSAQIDKAKNLYRKELEWMRRQPKARTTKSKNQSIEPDSGQLEWGETLNIGHFKQSGIHFNPNMRMIDYIKDIAESFPLSNGKTLSASQFLELFLFSPQQQYTPIGKLSGGEKKRLQLLTVLYHNPNFLILDEPTNDLDLPTLTVLENFLKEYQGCLLIVSHDRYFMDKVVDELLIFEGEGQISTFHGNYTEFFVAEKENTKETHAISETPNENLKPKTVPQKLSFKEKEEMKKLEKEIPQLEQEKEKITETLSTEGLAFEEIESLGNRLTTLIEQLETKEMRWLELSELMG